MHYRKHRFLFFFCVLTCGAGALYTGQQFSRSLIDILGRNTNPGAAEKRLADTVIIEINSDKFDPSDHSGFRLLDADVHYALPSSTASLQRASIPLRHVRSLPKNRFLDLAIMLNGKQVPLSRGIRENILKFLTNRSSFDNAAFDCGEFIRYINARNPVDDITFEIQESIPGSKSWRIGDCILLANKNPDIAIHYAIYLGDDTYLSMAGENGPLVTSSFSAMKEYYVELYKEGGKIPEAEDIHAYRLVAKWE